MNLRDSAPATVVGRYAVFDAIASGGMATVHYGRLLGPSGFSRTVAIKKLHPHLAGDAEFTAMFLDEARVAARVRHPNVVPTLDIVSADDQLLLVMEYVQGESLSRLMRAAKRMDAPMPPSVAAAILVGVLHGLHAAHEATDERGRPLGIVHRDVSPQNVLVGLDGIPRLVDFGVAKALGRVQTTRDGQIKGKIAYMAPEQIRGATPTRRMDVYAAAVVFWEMLTLDRLFGGDNDVTVLERALHHEPAPPSALAEGISPELDAVVLRALSRDPAKRFSTAREMAREIENVTQVASVSKVGEWVDLVAGEAIAERASKVAEIESHSQIRAMPSSPPSVEPPAEPTEVSAPLSDSRKRRLVAQLAVAALALVGVIVALVAWTRRQDAPSNAIATTTATAAPSAAPTVSATAAGATTASSPPLASAPIEPAARATSAPKPHARTPIIRDFPTTRPGAKPGCNPPYTIDSNGVKQYKIECL